MKKLLLLLVIIQFTVTTQGQFAFNEVYARPNGGQTEYLEIFNNAKTNVNINLDCFTILAYWKQNAGNRGWYVLNLPAHIIAPGGYYTLSEASSIIYQNGNSTANLNWNSLPAGATLTQWQYDGVSGYNNLGTPSNLGDFVEEHSGLGFKNLILIFKQNSLEQAFLGGSNSTVVDAEVTNLPDLIVNNLTGACTSASFQFSNLSNHPKISNVGSASGTNNGFSRLYDGNCSPWVKSSSGPEHTPNITNNNAGSGGTSPYDGTIVTGQLIQCATQTTANVLYNITGITGAATVANSFPVNVEIFNDLGTIGQYDPGVDQPLTVNQVTNINQGPFSYTVTGSNSPKVIILYTTANGCYDAVFALQAFCAILPADMISFNATRRNSSAILKWQTANEQNSRGFAIERNNGNDVWKEVGFVPSQAPGGNSSSLLSYEFTDNNDSRSITQYRIKQTDFDGRVKLSEVRSVRGLDQVAGIVVYPNPSSDGKVTVVFDNTNTLRELAVSDMSGRAIKQIKAISQNSVVIDNLPSGMFTLRVLIPSTGELSVQKIVVNRK